LSTTVASAATGSNCPAGATDPRCATQVTVSELIIVNTADTATTTPTADVGYTVTATNAGQTPYWTRPSPSTPATCSKTPPKRRRTADTGTLAFDTTAAPSPGPAAWPPRLRHRHLLRHRQHPDADVADTTLTETATRPRPEPTAARRHRPPLHHQRPRPGPRPDHHQDREHPCAVPGATVTYTITVADAGDTPYAGATVTDSLSGVLPDAAYNTDAAATAGAVSYASPVLTWTGDLTVARP